MTFKNNTGAIDTLDWALNDWEEHFSSELKCPSNVVVTGRAAYVHFKWNLNTLPQFTYTVKHNEPPLLNIGSFNQSLNSGMTSATINNINYSDVFILSTDSNNLPSNIYPYKVFYSLSKGLLRLDLKGNQSWVRN